MPRLFDGRTLGSLEDISHDIGVATACGIDQRERRIGWNIVETTLDGIVDERTETAEGEQYLFHAPVSKPQRSLARIGTSRQHLHLIFIDFQHIDISQRLNLIDPIDSMYMTVAHLAQKSLNIEHKHTFRRKMSNQIDREIIGKQAAQNDVSRLNVVKLG